MRKLVLIWCFLIYAACPLLSQEQNDTIQTPQIYSWYVDSIGQTVRHPIDTNLYDSHRFNQGLGNINLGHLGSPVQHHRFFQRKHTSFLFSEPYQGYFRNNNNAHYFKTKTPFTFLKFATGGQQDTEARLWVKHTQNINQALNLGLDISLIGSQKFYENDRSLRGRYLNFFGSYKKNNYSLYGNINLNKIMYNELGGIQNKEDFELVEQRYLPGNLEGAKTLLKDQSFNLIQKLSLKETSLSDLNIFEKLGQRKTFQKTPPAEEADTLERDTTGQGPEALSPQDTLQTGKEEEVGEKKKDTTRFYAYHRLTFSNNVKSYTDESPLSPYYNEFPVYMDSTATRDSARQRSLRNRFKLVYANNFLTVHAGMNHSFINYSYVYPYQTPDMAVDYDRLLTRNYNNLSVSAGWEFRSDSIFSLRATGEYYLLGFRAGDFNLQGGLNLAIDNNTLAVEADYRYQEPDYFYQYYNSNYFRWDQKLSKTSRLDIKGHFDIESINTRLSLKSLIMNNYTYLDTSSLPAQYSQNLELITASVRKDFQFWKFHSMNKLVFQYTDQYDVLGIPRFYLHHRFAFRHKFHFAITGGNLYTQLGWSLYYYPSYYTDDYMPALGLYHRQRDEKIGDTPLFNLFANFRVKRVNIFGKLYHLNSFIQERNYYTAPLYPMSPMMVKFGVSWSFYD
ncbi:MAG: putative porin [Bacteroidales bacterium]